MKLISLFIFLSSLVHATPIIIATDKLDEIRLINGTPVPPGEWPSVIRIRTGSSSCTATVIGKKVAVTAAHCASSGSTSTFQIAGKTYSGKVTRSPLYAMKDHDIAVIVTSEEIAVKPSSVGGKAEKEKPVTILGYGCVKPGGGGGNDGILRIGTSKITAFNAFYLISSNKPGGAALCYGDSGGPLFDMSVEGKPRLLGINSKGNIVDTNYNTRNDIPETTKFLADVASANNVKICGVNEDCDGPPPAPPIISENDAVKLEAKNKGLHTDDYIKRHLDMLAEFLSQAP